MHAKEHVFYVLTLRYAPEERRKRNKKVVLGYTPHWADPTIYANKSLSQLQ